MQVRWKHERSRTIEQLSTAGLRLSGSIKHPSNQLTSMQVKYNLGMNGKRQKAKKGSWIWWLQELNASLPLPWSFHSFLCLLAAAGGCHERRERFALTTTPPLFLPTPLLFHSALLWPVPLHFYGACPHPAPLSFDRPSPRIPLFLQTQLV